MIRAGSFNECGQGTVEFALVTAAFLAAVIALGALWRGLEAGMFVDHALMSASHHIQMTMRDRSPMCFCTDGFGKEGAGMRRTCESGQATVEAAFLLPVLFVGLLLLMQPGILLYDRLVMQAAASEGCRLLATKTAAAGDMAESCEAFVRHRLGAIPPVSCFHVHEARAAGTSGSKATSARTWCASPSRTRLVRCRCWMQAALCSAS